MLKLENQFIKLSDDQTINILQNNLLKRLINFDVRSVNEETLELLEPYFNLKSKDGKRHLLDDTVALMASAGLAGLVKWLHGTAKCAEIKGKVEPKIKAQEAKA